MESRFLNATNYANIYGLFIDGKCIGTKTVTLAGRNAGTTFQTWGARTKTEVRKLFAECEK